MNASPSFSVGSGLLINDFGGEYCRESGMGIVLQADGNILVSATASYINGGTTDYSRIAMVRYLADGSADRLFGGNGVILAGWSSKTLDYVSSLRMQDDGKIFVSGAIGGTNAIVRYNIDGSLDRSFSDDGMSPHWRGYGYGIDAVTQLDGMLVQASSSGTSYSIGLVRYTPDGRSDLTFGRDGFLLTPLKPTASAKTILARQSDGKFLLAGYSSAPGRKDKDFSLIRYNPDWSIDTTFGAVGLIRIDGGDFSDDYVSSITLQPDGKIIIVGETGSGSALLRYRPDGGLDTAFGLGGKIISLSGIGGVIELQADGKILTGSSINGDFAIRRLNTDGSLDRSFGEDGLTRVGFDHLTSSVSDDTVNALKVQADGKILVLGRTSNGKINDDIGLVRLNSDGSLDLSFGGKSTLGGTISVVEDGLPVVLDPDVQVYDAELRKVCTTAAEMTADA